MVCSGHNYSSLVWVQPLERGWPTHEAHVQNSSSPIIHVESWACQEISAMCRPLNKIFVCALKRQLNMNISFGMTTLWVPLCPAWAWFKKDFKKCVQTKSSPINAHNFVQDLSGLGRVRERKKTVPRCYRLDKDEGKVWAMQGLFLSRRTVGSVDMSIAAFTSSWASLLCQRAARKKCDVELRPS